MQVARGLNNFINNGKLSSTDLGIAKSLLEDLLNALTGN